MSNRCENKLELIGTPEEVNQVLAFISSKDDKGADILFDFNKVIPIPEELIDYVYPEIVNQTEGKEATPVDDFGTLDEPILRNKKPIIKEGKYTDPKNDAKDHYQLNDKELNKYISEYPEERREELEVMIGNLKKTGFADTHDWCVENWGARWVSEIHIENNIIWFLTPWTPPLPIIEKLSSLFPAVKFSISYGGPEFDPFRYYKIIYKEGVKIYQQMEYDLEEEKKHYEDEKRSMGMGNENNERMAPHLPDDLGDLQF